MTAAAAKRRILVIEDDDALRGLLRLMLSMLDYAVITARNGEEGLRIQASEPADLVLTDILMPNKEGIETILELRRAQPSLKIITMSGGGQVGARDHLQMACACGAEGVLEKPFTAATLAAAIARLLPR